MTRENQDMGEKQKSDVFSDNFGASEMKFPEREFQRMKRLAEENMQPNPYNYFQDGNSFWAEVEGRNPIFLCHKTKKGWLNFEKGDEI